jgi:hypothetical protein
MMLTMGVHVECGNRSKARIDNSTLSSNVSKNVRDNVT